MKISSIYCIMSQYVARHGSNILSFANRSAPWNTAEERAASQSWTQVSRCHTNTNALAKQKCNIDTSSQVESSAKRKKSTLSAGSLAFGLTHVDQRAGKSAEPILDYEKFVKVQIDF